MKFILVVITLFFLIDNSFASCGTKRRVLFFANGMFNDKKSAHLSLEKLVEQYLKDNPKSNFDNYELAYNTNEIVLLQLLQVFHQKLLENKIGFFRWLEKFNDSEKDLEFQIKVSKYLNEETIKDRDLKIQIESYRTYLSKDYSVVTVAHSQGNFYTNFAFSNLKSERTKMVSVATPAGYVYRDGPYYTFKSDGVINTVVGALTPNRAKKKAGYFDHEFIMDYLADDTISKEVVQSVYESAFDQNDSAPSFNILDSYYNSDMTPVLKWFNQIMSKKSNVNSADCVMAYALLNIHRLSGLSCEERNLKLYKQSIQDCILDRNDLNQERAETACPFFSNFDARGPFSAFYISEGYDFLEKHSFCKMEDISDFENKIKIRDLEEALDKF